MDTQPKILLVDDEAAITDNLAPLLERSGFEVTIARDGQQALDAIARVLDVAWVQDLALQEKHNEYAAGGIMGATVANGLGYLWQALVDLGARPRDVTIAGKE